MCSIGTSLNNDYVSICFSVAARDDVGSVDWQMARQTAALLSLSQSAKHVHRLKDL